MLKAALPALPGVNLIPGIAQEGQRPARPDAAPQGRRGRPATTSRRTPGSAGSRARTPCRFTYPHMLAFPLHMGIMTDSVVPVPRDRHGARREPITQHRPIAPGERLDVSASAVNLRPHAKGRVFDLVTTVHAPAGRPSGSRPRTTSASARATRQRRPSGTRSTRRARDRDRVEASRQPGPRVRRGLRRPQPDPPLPAHREGVRLPAPDRPRHVEQGPVRGGVREPSA